MDKLDSVLRRLKKVKASSVAINLYKLNIATFIAGALIPMLTNFFTSKMSCDYWGDFNSHAVIDYCFIYGTTYISESFREEGLCGIYQGYVICHNHFSTATTYPIHLQCPIFKVELRFP